MFWDLNKSFMQRGISLADKLPYSKKKLIFYLFAPAQASFPSGCSLCPNPGWVIIIIKALSTSPQYSTYTRIILPVSSSPLQQQLLRVHQTRFPFLSFSTQLHFPTSLAAGCGHCLSQVDVMWVKWCAPLAGLAIKTSHVISWLSPSHLLAEQRGLCGHRGMWKEPGTWNGCLEQSTSPLTNLNWTEMRC